MIGQLLPVSWLELLRNDNWNKNSIERQEQLQACMYVQKLITQRIFSTINRSCSTQAMELGSTVNESVIKKVSTKVRDEVENSSEVLLKNIEGSEQSVDLIHKA